jgi:hypothetical protein
LTRLPPAKVGAGGTAIRVHILQQPEVFVWRSWRQHVKSSKIGVGSKRQYMLLFCTMNRAQGNVCVKRDQSTAVLD